MYEFTLVQQKGTFFWHAHVSWLRATVYGAIIVYPKKGVPYPFKFPYEEHIIILGTLIQYSYLFLEEFKFCVITDSKLFTQSCILQLFIDHLE